MSLAAHSIGHRFGPKDAPHVIEMYLDFTCPYSGRAFIRMYDEILPSLKNTPIQFIFRNQIQPWHPQSAIVHEASIAVEAVNPDVFLKYCRVLFEKQGLFYDVNTWNKSRTDIHVELAELAEESLDGGVRKEDVLGWLNPAGKEGNCGNKLTDRMLYHVKLARQNGIHVSPTTLLDGIIERSIESSWTLEQWKQLIKAKWNM